MKFKNFKTASFVGILFGALALLPSCSNEADTPDVPTATVVSAPIVGSSKVTKADAIDIASVFNESRFGKTASRSSQNVEVVANQMGAPMAYVVNQEDGGWVMVSATKNYHPILAYSDDANGRFDLSSGRAFTGLGIWLEEVAADIEASDSFTEEQSAQITAEWSQLENGAQTLASGIPTGNSPEAVKCRNRLKELNDAYYKDGWTFTTLPNVSGVTLPNDVYTTADNVGSPYEYTIVGLKDESIRSEVAPMLTTTWKQEGFCTTSDMAGCVPIAMGQIMKYHQYPTYIDWNKMPDNSASEATKAFIDGIRGVLGMGTNDEGASISDAIKGFKYYDYSVTETGYNLSGVCMELGSGRPVYMRGNRTLTIGHAWVCDGLIRNISEYKYYVEYLNSVTEYTNYGMTLMSNPGSCAGISYTNLHMNWGWGGQDDGWYINPTPPGKDYSSNRKDLYVKPN